MVKQEWTVSSNNKSITTSCCSSSNNRCNVQYPIREIIGLMGAHPFVNYCFQGVLRQPGGKLRKQNANITIQSKKSDFYYRDNMYSYKIACVSEHCSWCHCFWPGDLSMSLSCSDPQSSMTLANAGMVRFLKRKSPMEKTKSSIMETEYFWQNKIHNKEATSSAPWIEGKKNGFPEESKCIAFKISAIAGIMTKGDRREW